MIGFGQHFDTGPCNPPIALDGLIGIGIGAHRKWRRTIGWLHEFGAKQRGGIGLGEELGFEINPGREVVERMCWPRKAINAAVFAAAIGIDRAVKRNVWRFIACDDRFRTLDSDAGAHRRQYVIDHDAIIKPVAVINPVGKVEAIAGAVMRCAAMGAEEAHSQSYAIKRTLQERCLSNPN